MGVNIGEMFTLYLKNAGITFKNKKYQSII